MLPVHHLTPKISNNISNWKNLSETQLNWVLYTMLSVPLCNTCSQSSEINAEGWFKHVELSQLLHHTNWNQDEKNNAVDEKDWCIEAFNRIQKVVATVDSRDNYINSSTDWNIVTDTMEWRLSALWLHSHFTLQFLTILNFLPFNFIIVLLFLAFPKF